jgi:hypothetical protein
MTLLPYTWAHARSFGGTENSQPVLLQRHTAFDMGKFLNG